MTDENTQPSAEEAPPTEQGASTALGDGATPPASEAPANTEGAISADDYQLTIDGFDFDKFKSDEGNQAFLGKLAEQGVSNDVLSTIMGEYQKHLGSLDQRIDGMIQAHSDQTTASLQKEWAGDYDQKLDFAKNALLNAGFTKEQFNDPKVGNNEALIKLAAHFGEQMQEDAPPQNTHQSQSQGVQELMLSEAYNDPKHPQHQRVYQQVQAYYAKQNS